jgi:hypothetical protein
VGIMLGKIDEPILHKWKARQVSDADANMVQKDVFLE